MSGTTLTQPCDHLKLDNNYIFSIFGKINRLKKENSSYLRFALICIAEKVESTTTRRSSSRNF